MQGRRFEAGDGRSKWGWSNAADPFYAKRTQFMAFMAWKQAFRKRTTPNEAKPEAQGAKGIRVSGCEGADGAYVHSCETKANLTAGGEPTAGD